MKISEFIKYLKDVKSEHGDIDVLCVTPGMASAWETATPTKDVNDVSESSDFYKEHYNITSDMLLIIGIDG